MTSSSLSNLSPYPEGIMSSFLKVAKEGPVYFTLKLNFSDGYPNESQSSFFSFGPSLLSSSDSGVSIYFIIPIRSAFSMANSSLSSF